MDWTLGLDGGGTGCRAVLADRTGAVLGRGEGGPANIMSDREGALRNIMAAAEAAGGRLELAQVAVGDGTPRHDPERLAQAYARVMGVEL